MPRLNWSRKDEVRGIQEGYRSGLERANQTLLRQREVPFLYEEVAIPYLRPARPAKYTPDFVLTRNGIIVETKGRFITEDRQKHLHVRAQHPDLDIRFVFSNPRTRISKQSVTTYADWCSGKNPQKASFLYAAAAIPQAWADEEPNAASLRALRDLGLKL